MKRLRPNTTLIAISLLSAMGLFATACGKDNKKDDTTKNEEDRSELIASLEEQIKALEDLIKDTAEEEMIASLTDDLKTLQDLLEELQAPECGEEGGTCVGPALALAQVEPVIGGVCSHIFDCCTSSQALFSLGTNATTEDQCTAVLTARVMRGESSFFYGAVQLPLPIGVRDMPHVVAGLEDGSLVVNEAKVTECLAALSSLDCEDSYKEEQDSCGEETAIDACYGLFTGAVKSGEPCTSIGEDYWINQCEEGAFCQGGTCTPTPAIGEDCGGENWCGFDAYCNAETQVCTAFAAPGDDCRFADPSGQNYNNDIVDRCEQGSACNIFTGKCVASCDAGVTCNSDYNCANGFYCNTTVTDDLDHTVYGEYPANPGSAYNESGTINGTCAAQFPSGADCEYGSQCLSGGCGDDSKCTTVDARCEENSDCPSTEFCDESYCVTKRSIDESCSEDDQCAGGMCANGSCDSVGATLGACNGDSESSREQLVSASRACITGEACTSAGTCAPVIALDASCASAGSDASKDVACGAGRFCTGETQVCAARTLTRGQDCTTGGNQAYWETPTHRGCATGLVCHGYFGADDTEFVCLPEEEGSRADGESCYYGSTGVWASANYSYLCASNNCVPDTGTVMEPEGTHGVCAPAVAAGGACNAYLGTYIAWSGYDEDLDPCAEGFFCAPVPGANLYSSPTDGTCQPMSEPGEICGRIAPSSFEQCTGDSYCTSVDDGIYRCSPDYLEGMMCPLGGGGGPSVN